MLLDRILVTEKTTRTPRIHLVKVIVVYRHRTCSIGNRALLFVVQFREMASFLCILSVTGL